METKTIHALLLSFVMVAGAVTINDAFAQSNTDRLIHVVETTDNSNNMLMAIQAALDSISAQVMSLVDAVAGVAASVSGVSDQVSAVQSGVDSVGMGVSGVSDSVSAIGMDVSSIRSSVSHVDEHVSEVKSAVDAISTEISGMQASLGATGAAITGPLGMIQSSVDNNSMQASSIQESVDMANEKLDSIMTVTDALEQISASISSNSDKISSLESTISDINTRLDSLSSQVGDVGTAVETTVGPAPVNLYKKNTMETITLSHYGDAAQGKLPTNSKYQASYALSCDTDVFIDTVMYAPATYGPSKYVMYPAIANINTGYDSSIVVNGMTLYDTNYEVGGSIKTTPYNRDANFNLMELHAGDMLSFTSEFTSEYHDNTDGDSTYLDTYVKAKYGDTITIDSASPVHLGEDDYPKTKAALGQVGYYTITVNWYSASNDTTCSFMRTSGDSTALSMSASKNLILQTVKADENSISKRFQSTFDCNKLTTRVVDINTEIAGLPLYQYSTLQLLTGDAGSSNEVTRATFEFHNNGTVSLKTGELPFEFDGVLRINGTLAGQNAALATISYVTNEGNTCTIDETEIP